MTTQKKRKYGNIAEQLPPIDSVRPEDIFASFDRPRMPTSTEQTTIAQPAIALGTIAPEKPLLSHGAIVAQPAIALHSIVTTQYTSIPNDILDKILKTLHVYDQVVLIRLYRLSRGHHKDTCMVGYGTLAKACNISIRQAQISVERLLAAKWIERLSVEQGGAKRSERGSVYQVKLPAATIARPAIVQRAIARDATNKENTLKETHTNTEGVGVCSRFSLKDCRAYADTLKSEGIQNPGGYATKIHRTGEADELIQRFLTPPALSPTVDASQCPDCQGSGWWYPKGTEKGIARCKHERLGV